MSMGMIMTTMGMMIMRMTWQTTLPATGGHLYPLWWMMMIREAWKAHYKSLINNLLRIFKHN